MERDPRCYFYSKKGVLCEWLGNGKMKVVQTGNTFSIDIDIQSTVFYTKSEVVKSLKGVKISRYGKWDGVQEELKMAQMRLRGELDEV